MMRSRHVAVLAAIFLTLSAASQARLKGEGSEASSMIPLPQLTVTAGPVWPNNYGTVMVSNVLLSDRTVRTYIAIGSSEIPSPCAVSGGDVQKDGSIGPEGALVTWIFEMRLKSSDRSGARVALHWTRTVHDPAAVDAETIERSYEISLSEHQTTVLDLVRPRELTKDNNFGPTSCEGVALELGLKFADPPELENALLDYDIWLLQTDGNGRQFTDRVQPRGFQGRDIQYAFGRQHYEADGTRSDAGPVALSLSCTVKGRVRPDGRIDLVVSLGRTVFVKSLGSGDGGFKQETLADGETIELTIPHIADRLRDLPNDSGLYRTETAIRVTVRRIS